MRQKLLTKIETKKPLIFPALLLRNSLPDNELKTRIIKINDSGADGIHLDVGKGKMIDKTIFYDPAYIRKIKEWTDLPIDAHLMVHNPQIMVNFALEGVNMISFHCEAEWVKSAIKRIPKDVYKLIDFVKEKDVLVGMAVQTKTSWKDAEVEMANLIPMLDFYVLMSVPIGKQGQKFVDISDKIIEVKSYDIIVQVDGGINGETSKIVRNAGADIIVTGGFFRDAKDKAEAVRILRGEI